MTLRTLLTRLSCGLLLVVGHNRLYAQPSVATKAMTVERAIKLFAGLEREYKALEWTLQLERFQLRDANDSSSTIPNAESPFYVADVRFDPQTSRYVIKSQKVTHWFKTEGASPVFLAMFESRGFDGKVHRKWSQEKEVKSLEAASLEFAKMAPKLGLVTDHQADSGDSVNEHGLTYGFALMPPFAFDYEAPPLPVSMLLERRRKEGTKVEVSEEDTGIVNVTYHVRYPWLTATDPPGTFEGRFDVNKGGACLGWTIFLGDDAKKMEFRRCEFKNFEAAPGLWAPEQIALVEPMEKPPRVTKYTMTNVRVNPTLDAKAYVLEFPVGTHVDDHLAGKSYNVTGGAIDEQAAVKDFIARHGLQARPRTGGMWTKFGIAGLAVIVMAGAWALRRRWRSAAVFTFAMFASESIADEPKAGLLIPVAETVESDTGIDYIVSHHPAEQIRIAECGFTVSLFALEHFGISYDLKFVRAALRPTDRGIRLADINDLLKAYGLRCEAREKVEPAALERAIKNGYLAIFPIRTGKNADHYLAALLGPDNQPKGVDVLSGVFPLRDMAPDMKPPVFEGVVLLVRAPDALPARTRTPLSGSLRANPTVVELGVFPLTGAEALVQRRAEFVLENTSANPVLVKTVSVSCGCTDLDWKGGLIRANSKQTVSVLARPLAWGPGKQSKRLAFQFLDDSELQVDITGEGQTAAQIQQVTVAPQSLRYEIGADAIAGRVSLTQELTVTGTADSLGTLRIQSSAPWLTVEPAVSTDHTRSWRAAVSLPEVLRLLEAGADAALAAELNISTKARPAPLVVSVSVQQKEFFTATARRLEMGWGDSSEVEFYPLSEEAKAVTIGNVQSDPPGLLFETRALDDGVKLLIRGQASTAPGLYVVRCELQADLKRRVSTDLVIRVKPPVAGTTTREENDGASSNR